uniref:Sm protein G n=1 Tax=Amorphochlora amoebiformis TaxID=1561963 RepID=A0A0H5BI37_9EUKA|nr:mRNA splicing factor snRNPG [Amorphochlora amoebiformis]
MKNLNIVPELSLFIEEKVSIKIKNGISITGTLRGFDQFLNVVVERQIIENNHLYNEIIIIRGSMVILIRSL